MIIRGYRAHISSQLTPREARAVWKPQSGEAAGKILNKNITNETFGCTLIVIQGGGIYFLIRFALISRMVQMSSKITEKLKKLKEADP